MKSHSKLSTNIPKHQKQNIVSRRMVTLKRCGESLIFNSGNNLVIYKEGNIKIVDLPKPVLKQQKKRKEEREVAKEEIKDVTISCLAVSKDNKLIAVSSNNKQVVILNEQFEILKTFLVARTSSAMCFNCSESLIVADKTGEVFLYDFKNNEPKPVLLLGHMSVVLDLVTTDCGKYVITCDRDEKIKVTNFPKTYCVQSFCLGHEEFVLCVNVAKNTLISASGDGTVRFWNYLDGKELAVLNTNYYIDEKLIEEFKEEMNSQGVEVSALPITDLQCLSTDNEIFIGVSLYQYKKLMLFSVSALDFKLNYHKQLYVGESFSFNLSYELFILTKTQIRMIKLENGIFKGETHKVLDVDDVHDLHFKSANNIILLYEKKYDNVEEYVKRKKARLRSK